MLPAILRQQNNEPCGEASARRDEAPDDDEVGEDPEDTDVSTVTADEGDVVQAPEEDIPRLFPDHPPTEPGEEQSDNEGWESCEEDANEALFPDHSPVELGGAPKEIAGPQACGDGGGQLRRSGRISRPPEWYGEWVPVDDVLDETGESEDGTE